jgi:uncharacterized SAM-binding protein YcdF (DUF218 family)
MFCWLQRLRFFQRRTICCPTLLGTLCIVCVLLLPEIWWFSCGESYLSLTRRLPAQVLIVEGWIGYHGIRAAKAEFEEHGYQYIVAAGGYTADGGWEKGGLSYAEGAQHELLRLGVPKEKIILAQSRDTETQRTYASAVAVWQALATNGIQPKTVNIFTFGPHARRSRLVFQKAYQPTIEVGVISWEPLGSQSVPWWKSSDRAKTLISESAGYVYEVLLNSGRKVNSAGGS